MKKLAVFLSLFFCCLPSRRRSVRSQGHNCQGLHDKARHIRSATPQDNAKQGEDGQLFDDVQH